MLPLHRLDFDPRGTIHRVADEFELSRYTTDYSSRVSNVSIKHIRMIGPGRRLECVDDFITVWQCQLDPGSSASWAPRVE